MLALEEMREVAAGLYLNEFGSSWKPVSSSRFSHGAMLTSALVEGRDFCVPAPRPSAVQRCPKARRWSSPVDAPGRLTKPMPDFREQCLGDPRQGSRPSSGHGARPWRRHQGRRPPGIELGRARGIPQVTFSLDMRLGARAGFKRNERMLSLDPRYVIAFPGNGVLERLVIDAKARRITVVDRRGPLGTKPQGTSARHRLRASAHRASAIGAGVAPSEGRRAPVSWACDWSLAHFLQEAFHDRLRGCDGRLCSVRQAERAAQAQVEEIQQLKTAIIPHLRRWDCPGRDPFRRMRRQRRR
jgi:hypothetical protein